MAPPEGDALEADLPSAVGGERPCSWSGRVPRPLVGQVTPIDDAPRTVPHLASDLVQFAVRQLLARDVGEERLGLIPCLFETGKLVAEVVAVETRGIAHVEEEPGHGRFVDLVADDWSM